MRRILLLEHRTRPGSQSFFALIGCQRHECRGELADGLVVGEFEPRQFRVDHPRIAGIGIEVRDFYAEEVGQHLRRARGWVLPGARTELRQVIADNWYPRRARAPVTSKLRYGPRPGGQTAANSRLSRSAKVAAPTEYWRLVLLTIGFPLESSCSALTYVHSVDDRPGGAAPGPDATGSGSGARPSHER